MSTRNKLIIIIMSWFLFKCALARWIRFRKYPLDTGCELNVHRISRKCPGRLLNVLCAFNLRPVNRGYCKWIIACSMMNWVAFSGWLEKFSYSFLYFLLKSSSLISEPDLLKNLMLFSNFVISLVLEKNVNNLVIYPQKLAKF